MTDPRPVLTGYRYSVYTRVARIALAEKGVDYDTLEYDPFDPESQGQQPHPFGRVPVFDHNGLRMFETAAITAYVDAAFTGPSLMPRAPAAIARVTQVIGIVDAYLYWPLVRQVYSHTVFRPAFGETVSEDKIATGLSEAPLVLAALEDIAYEGLALSGPFTRADCHLAPMIAAFTAAPQGDEMLANFAALSNWWAKTRERASLRTTLTSLPSPSGAG